MDLYPFKKYSTKVPADWVDFNGHMNTKHYGLVIYDAHIEFTKHLDLGEPLQVRQQLQQGTC